MTVPARRARLAALGALLVVVLLLAVGIGPPFLGSNGYADAASIEKTLPYRDPALMKAAWSLPVAARYRRGAFEYQRNQSVCGPTSIADVLRSLGVARSQEQVLAGARQRAFLGYLIGGMTLDEVAGLLARQAGRPVRILRGPTLARFRAEMRAANDLRRRIVANFHRGPMFGRGHGHFSPILGYLPERDLVLVGDVNPAYRPYLVSTDRLWSAVNTIDAETGKPRGLAILTL